MSRYTMTLISCSDSLHDTFATDNLALGVFGNRLGLDLTFEETGKLVGFLARWEGSLAWVRPTIPIYACG